VGCTELLTPAQMADRFKYFGTDKNRVKIASSYVETVPKRQIFFFTLVQFSLLAIIYGVTWTPAAISFPIFILLLVPLRRYILPKFFSEDLLLELDSDSESGIFPPIFTGSLCFCLNFIPFRTEQEKRWLT